ncbi:hypothetical protein QFC24_005646 [Naganishia onofrii]|uniref:Uncharacterized protein n=1 Tax=Naganishia onofrii TaxID=1851511 RepID=A0ACC2X6K5_9TREE|nr:hypothetical protein QFC24_005646 [Naganishia onofrii]
MSAVEEQSLLSTVLGFFVPTAQCEAASPAPEDAHLGDAVEATTEDNNANDDAPEEEEASGADDEEEEEPEDIAPQIREECENTKECSPALHHFQACSEKVNSGKGWHGGKSLDGFWVGKGCCAGGAAGHALGSERSRTSQQSKSGMVYAVWPENTKSGILSASKNAKECLTDLAFIGLSPTEDCVEELFHLV